MKTALITGANKGIGLETARQLAGQGIFVNLGCRRTAAGEQALQTLQAEGLTNTAFIEIDVTSDESVTKAKNQLQEKTPVLDILINNAGILGRVAEPEKPLTVTDVKNVFETNFFGVIRVTQAFMPLLQRSAAARIVNVTSDLASLTRHNDPNWKYYQYKNISYGPSKTALNAYTVALAYQLRDTNCKVNAVNPGHTATEFNNYRGTKPPQLAAQVIVQYALIGENGPTGKFFDEDGAAPW